MKRLIAMLLAVCMICSLIVMPAAAEEADTVVADETITAEPAVEETADAEEPADEAEAVSEEEIAVASEDNVIAGSEPADCPTAENVDSLPSIELDTAYIADLKHVNQSVWVKFTAPYSGDYALVAGVDEDLPLWVGLFGSQMEIMGGSEESGEIGGSYISAFYHCVLEEGQTYVYVVNSSEFASGFAFGYIYLPDYAEGPSDIPTYESSAMGPTAEDVPNLPCVGMNMASYARIKEPGEYTFVRFDAPYSGGYSLVAESGEPFHVAVFSEDMQACYMETITPYLNCYFEWEENQTYVIGFWYENPDTLGDIMFWVYDDENGDNGGGQGGSGVIVPPVEEMPAMPMDEWVTVTASNDEWAWLSFTPAEDGVYMFRSKGTDGDPYIRLYDGEQNEVEYDDDGAGDLQFLLAYNMTAGQTYTLGVGVYSQEARDIRLIAEKCPVVDVSVEKDVYVYENSLGEYLDWGDGEFFCYNDWRKALQYTATLENGNVMSGTGHLIYFKENQRVELSTWGDGQNLNNPWTVGNSYDVKVSALDKTFDVTVHIVPAPEEVALELKPVSTSWYEERWEVNADGEDTYYRHYWWVDALYGTITIDGQECQIRNGNFQYNGIEYRLWTQDDQGPDNIWQIGETYTGTAGIMNAQVVVEIQPSEDNGNYDEPTDAPPLEEMTALSLNEEATAEITEPHTKAWFTFTAEKDGVYMFRSLASDADTWAVLYNENLHELFADDDSGKDMNFMIPVKMQAGQTYVFGTHFNNDNNTGSYPVIVEESPIVDIQISDSIEIYEHTLGAYSEGAENQFEYYNWNRKLSYTYTTADGETGSGIGDRVVYGKNGLEFRFYDVGSNQPWELGETGKATALVLGERVDVGVTIVEAPKDVVIEIDQPVKTSWWGECWDWQTDETYTYYEWVYNVYGTITINGETCRINNNWFVYEGVEYNLWYLDDQGSDNVWQIGEMREGVVGFMNASVPVEIKVCENDDSGGGNLGMPSLDEMEELVVDRQYIANITYPGQQVWFKFTPAVSGMYIFSSSAEDVDPGVLRFDANGNYLDFADNNMQDMNFRGAWELEAGKTYAFAVQLYNDAVGQVPVILETSPVESIEIHNPVSIPEDAWGYDMENDGEIFFYYFWPEKADVTVHFKDGTSYTGNGVWFEYKGQTYQLIQADDQYENPWTVGNTYEGSLRYGDVTASTDVTITKSKIKSFSVEDVAVFENTGGYETEYGYYYYWWSNMRFTVTMKDGTKISNLGSYFEYDGDAYVIDFMDNQTKEPFEAGKTYTVTVCLGDFEENVKVKVLTEKDQLPRVENVRIDSVTKNSIKIKYDGVKPADKYEIYVNGELHGTTSKRYYTVDDLAWGEEAYIWVVAIKKTDGITYRAEPSEPVWDRTFESIENYKISLEYSSVEYNGEAYCPEVTVRKSSKSTPLVLGEDYEVHYEFNDKIGKAYAYISGVGKYGGNVVKTFEILPAQVENVNVTVTSGNSVNVSFNPAPGATEYWIYRDGKLVGKTAENNYDVTGLTAGKTYKFTVKAAALSLTDDEVYVGDACQAVSAKPQYTMEGYTVTLKYPSKAYTGKKLTNTVTVKTASGNTLKQGRDYTVSYENNVAMGMADVIIKGTGKYNGELVAQFAIGPKKVTDVDVEALSGTSARVTFDEMKGALGYAIYVDGEQVGFAETNEYVIEGLIAGQKHSVTVSACVEINGEMISGERSKAETVTPRHDICWMYFDFADGYQYTYTGKYIRPKVLIKDWDTDEVLVEGEDYTLSYKNNKKVGQASVKIQGKGAYTGYFTSEFRIMPAPVESLRVSDTSSTSVKLSWSKTSSAKYYMIYEELFDENGNPYGEICIEDKTTSGSYTIKNLKPGEVHYYTVYSVNTIKYKDKGMTFTDTVFAYTEPIMARAGTYIGDCKVSLEYTKATYAGEPMEPQVTVKTSSKKNAATLTQGVDYILAYENNNAPGKGEVTIVGIGEYAGTTSKTFTINLGKVENVTGRCVSDKEIEVSYDAVPGADEYSVYVNGSRKAKTSDTSVVIGGLKEGKTYKITVKATATVNGKSYTGSTSSTYKIKLVEPEIVVPPALSEIPAAVQLQNTKALQGKKIGCSIVYKGDPWCAELATALETLAAYYGASLVCEDGDLDDAKQTKQIENMIANGADMLMIDPVTFDGSSNVLEKAVERGIPVIIYDGTWSKGAEKAETTITWEQRTAGELAGSYLVEYVKEHMGGKATLLELTNAISYHCQNRYEGFHDVIDQANAEGCEITILDTVDFMGNRAAAHDIVLSTVWNSDVGFDFVISDVDNGAMGAVDALRELGDQTIKVISMGAYGEEPFSMLYNNDPNYLACVNVDPWVLAQCAMDSAIRYFEGDDNAANTYMSLYVVTGSNVKDFWTHF